MPPAEIGKYKILRELGRGAMGAVYLAEDPFIGRRVAIKVMRPQVEEGAERFLQEARTVGSLSHPNIVLLHDFGFVGELPYLVMEHVDGTILDRWLAEPRGAGDRLRVLAGLCRAVAYAHSRGVLHRDLKPSNVLVRSDGEAKLLDFGIALVENTRMTATGVVLGTPEYIAPELLGSGQFSPRSDMYALGLVAYELFGGRNPFAADTVAACLRRVLEVEPVPLVAGSAAPAEVAAEVMRCLAKDPLRRPESPERLLAATERALAAGLAPAPGIAMASSPTTRMATGTAGEAEAGRRRPQRPAWWMAAAALVGAGLVVGTWFLAAGRSPDEAAEGGARTASATRPEPAPQIAPATPSVSPSAAPVSPPVPLPVSVPAAKPAGGSPTRASRATTPLSAGPELTVQPEPSKIGSSTPLAVAPPPAETLASATAAEPANPDPARLPPAVEPAPAPAAAAAPAPAEVRPALPRLTALTPTTLRRGAGVTVHLRGEPFTDDWSVQFRRGGKIARQIRVLRSRRIGPGELELSLLAEEDTPLGTYSLILVNASGASTNAISFEVDL